MFNFFQFYYMRAHLSMTFYEKNMCILAKLCMLEKSVLSYFTSVRLVWSKTGEMFVCGGLALRISPARFT